MTESRCANRFARSAGCRPPRGHPERVDRTGNIAIAPPRCSAGKTEFMIARDRALRRRTRPDARPGDQRMTATLGGGGATNTTAPHAPATNIRLMPYLSPGHLLREREAPRGQGRQDVTKIVVPGENCRPPRMTEMLADMIRRSPRTTALPSPMATVVMAAANPLTCSRCPTRRCWTAMLDGDAKRTYPTYSVRAQP